MPDAPPAASEATVATFISRWSRAEAAERANYVLFLSELCDLLGVPRPDPAGPATEPNAYVFERAVTFHHRGSTKTTTGRIDLYKRDCFVLEAKQYASAKAEPTELSFDLTDDAPKSAKITRGSAAWDRAMLEALSQADRYARSLPDGENPPPFLIVVDVGHVIELYADFTQKGKNYLPFPDARSHRIKIGDLAKPDLRERLRLVWTTPLALDPAKRAAAVTREVAGYLAELAKSFEQRHEPKLVAEFLSRCLFCMFAEDVGLLPKEGFRDLLDSVKADTGAFVPMLELLFEDMNQGRFSGLLKKKLLYFNGGLFASAQALPVTGTQLGLLRKAAALEWRHVEPAIFGTLLERALSPDERHKLGAHYTPRAYVERLVLPTVIEPLREEWSAVRIAAVTLAQRGDLKAAKAEVTKFHAQLCAVRVLDPACGSGNFLYVALEQMKRLEGEVINLLRDLGDDTDFLNLQGATVDPHQFLGIELNARAAALAELVLWIGYLQWHFRVHGATSPAEPVLKKFNNIECRDAVLAYDKRDFAKGPDGKTRFVWDRRTFTTDPITGREIANEQAVRPLDTFVNPHPAAWPQADFIVGNPPFLGTARMREDLGDGYTETLRAAYPKMPESADFVMFWWHKAALETLAGRTRRFGFITTNSIRQTFNRRVVQAAMDDGIYLTFAIPDHPWIDATECAAVRIAMTVGASMKPAPEAKLQRITTETANEETGENEVQLDLALGKLSADLTGGAAVSGTVELKSNDGLTYRGVMLFGDGFIITPEHARELGLGKIKGLEKHIRAYRNGRDLTDKPRGAVVIDLFGLTPDDVRDKFPKVFQHVLTEVKPERDQNRDPKIKENWWLFGRPRPELRPALVGLPRYIATVETAKHRIFQFLEAEILPDNKLVVITLNDAFHLGALSSRVHTTYALTAGSWLGVGNDPVYVKTRCFDPFPFPDCTEKQKSKIRALAEELDAHRKRAQAKHGLGLTDIYNVLEKVRAGEALTTKDKALHDAALVSTLKQLHDDLDAAVADAYGWPWPLPDAEILEKVVALNTQRTAEEAKGHIRWLRPDYQKPLFAGTKQSSLALTDAEPAAASSGKSKIKNPKSKIPWPKTMAERAKAIESALAAATHPITSTELTAQFTRAKEPEVREILETLVALARAHPGDTKGTFVR
jgi:type II restriction/modification system DNA methylase subunit YeeA